MTIRGMRVQDIDEVAEVHCQAFPGFFLTRMGRRFLRSYYATVLDYEHSIALIDENDDNGKINGFVVGFHYPQRFYDVLSASRRKLAPFVLLALMRDPLLLRQVFQNSRRVGHQLEHPVDVVELSSIGVRRKGLGVGGDLIAAFCQKAAEAGAGSILLTTDSEANDSTRQFYERRGFVLNGHELRGERELCCYLLDLG